MNVRASGGGMSGAHQEKGKWAFFVEFTYKMNPEEQIKFPNETGKYQANCGCSLEVYFTLWQSTSLGAQHHRNATQISHTPVTPI